MILELSSAIIPENLLTGVIEYAQRIAIHLEVGCLREQAQVCRFQANSPIRKTKAAVSR
jgi:hypothetical protein